MTAVQNRPDRQEGFAQTIRGWKSDYLSRCLIAPDVNEVAKEAIRQELQRRGIDPDQATVRATEEKAELKKPMTFRDKLLLWGPTLAIILGLAIGLFLFTLYT